MNLPITMTCCQAKGLQSTKQNYDCASRPCDKMLGDRKFHVMKVKMSDKHFTEYIWQLSKICSVPG